MSITLSDGITTVVLPADLQWLNEFSWSSIEQDQVYSLTGALVIQEGTKQKGRTISLGSGDGAWLTRADVQQLKTLEALPDQNLTLSYYGTNYTVRFDRSTTPIQADEVVREANPGATHLYTITINLIEV